MRRSPTGPGSQETDEAALGDRVIALDDEAWAVVLESGAVVVPPGGNGTWTVLTWSVGRRHAWPVRWGGVEVLPNVREATERLRAGGG